MSTRPMIFDAAPNVEMGLICHGRHMEPEEPGYVSGSSLEESHTEEEEHKYRYTRIDSCTHNDSYPRNDDGAEDDGTDDDGRKEEEGIGGGKQRIQVAMTESLTAQAMLDSYYSKTDKGDNSYDADVEDVLDVSNLSLSEITLISELNRVTSDFLRNIPNLKDWVDSWPSVNNNVQKGYYYLNIFGYYRKEKKMGGYGVILRDPCGRPVIASASVLLRGKSYLYHVLDGVNAGLSLAIKHGIYNLKLMCNSLFLDRRLSMIFLGVERDANRFCPAEIWSRYMYAIRKEYFDSLWPLLVEILEKRSEIQAKTNYFFLEDVFRADNRAAYCVAKQHAKTFENKLASPHQVYEPVNFSDELKMILWRDCFKENMKYSEQVLSL